MLFIIYLCIQSKLQEYLRQPEYNYAACNLAKETRFFQKVLHVLANRHLQKPCCDQHLGFSHHPKQASSCQRMPLHATRYGFGLEKQSSSWWLAAPSCTIWVFLWSFCEWAMMRWLGDPTMKPKGCTFSLPFPSQETYQACHSTNRCSILKDCLYLCGQPNI